MLMQKPAAFFETRLPRARPVDRAPALGLETVLWFMIGLILTTLLAYASLRYGIVSPDIMD
jgi:hypothetical protein